jgi:hypothetical protein
MGTRLPLPPDHAGPAGVENRRNGKAFRDGAKTAKIHWKPKKSAEAPAPTIVPDTLHDIDFVAKDSNRFAETADADTPSLTMTPRPTHSRRLGAGPIAGTLAIRW